MKDESFYRFISFLKKIRFGWLAPFFLLIKNEDPKAQCKAIFSGVVTPILSVLIFLWVWDISSKQIVTKFGTVPGPKQVWSAWKGLGNEMRLEQIKEYEHVNRVRAKRLSSLDRYGEVVKDYPGEFIEEVNSAKTKTAMEHSNQLVDQANELLEVYNVVSTANTIEEAQLRVAGFNHETSKNFSQTILLNLVPMEIAYRKHESELNNGPKWIPADGDSEKVVRSKNSAFRKETKKLAMEKAALLIERQKLTTRSTKLAYEIITSLPKGFHNQLTESDKATAIMASGLNGWYQEILKKELATGEKYKGKTRLKMLLKTFKAQPYSGKDTYYGQIITSLKTVFFGFCIASIIAIPLGLVCGLNPGINNAFNPIIQIFKPVSPLAWLPIVMIVVGAIYVSDDPMFELSFLNSAITVALCSLWPTLVNTSLGVSSTEKDYLNVAKVLKLGWYKKITKIILPAAMPLVFTGLRLSLGVGWMVLIAAEMLAQNPGLGKFVWDMFQNGSSETLSMIMVAVFTIGIIGFMLDTIMLSLQELVSFE